MIKIIKVGKEYGYNNIKITYREDINAISLHQRKSPSTEEEEWILIPKRKVKELIKIIREMK